MKFASLVLSGSLLVVLAGCSSDGDSGRVSTLTEELALTQEELETAEAALETAQSQRDAARNTLTTTQTELDEAEEDLGTAQTQLTTAQQEAAAQQVLAQEAQQEETSAEIITRAFGLLEAMDEAVRADSNNPDPANERIFAASVLGSSHPLEPPDPVRSPRISNNAPTIRQTASGSVQLSVLQDFSGEFSRGGGIPSLSMGGTSLQSALLQNTNPLHTTQEMAIYTDFKARNPVLLDHYDDFRREVAGTKQNEINVTNAGAAGSSISANEKMRDRTDNVGMYAGLDDVLALQPRLSGVTLGDANYPLVEANYTEVFESERLAGLDGQLNTTDDMFNNTLIHYFPAAFRGVSGRVQFRTVLSGLQNAMENCQATPSLAACSTAAAGATLPSFTIMTVEKAGTTNTYEPLSYDASGTGWTFKPGSPAVRVYVDDRHYLYFGWWQQTPDQADGVYDYHILAGAQGRWLSSYSLKAQDNVVYTGPAVGKYVRTISAHDELDHAGERRRNAVDGTFTASARLEADFGATDQVKGTITNFQDGGQPIPGNWQVILMGGNAGSPPASGEDAQAFPGTATNQEASISFSTTDPDVTGVALIKQGGQAGAFPEEDPTGRRAWEVTFLADERTRSLTDAGQESLPPSAVGRFDVGIEEVIHFSGAFGVTTNQ